MLGISQGLLTVRAVEHAARRVGADKLTGQAVFDTMLADTFTEDELMGILPSLKFSSGGTVPIAGRQGEDRVGEGRQVPGRHADLADDPVRRGEVVGTRG